MHKHALKFGSQLATVPETCGKAWAQVVGSVGARPVHKTMGSTQPQTAPRNVGTNTPDVPTLYTKCTRVIARLVSQITPVKLQLSPVYTAPTTITTTYINNRREA